MFAGARNPLHDGGIVVPYVSFRGGDGRFFACDGSAQFVAVVDLVTEMMGILRPEAVVWRPHPVAAGLVIELCHDTDLDDWEALFR